MTDRENFLERWSRRKIDAGRETPEQEKPREAAEPVAESVASVPATEAPETKPASSNEPEFDITSLPPIESITAGTDVRAFLAPGVPQSLARAALRRAWTADPAIRDFKGLAENDWDFTDPNAMPGFGALPQDFDVRKAVAEVFRKAGDALEQHASSAPEPEAQPAQAPAESAQTSSVPVGVRPPLEQTPADDNAAPGDGSLPQRTNNIAMQQDHPEPAQDQPKVRRTHGRALPK